jgi:hypothetical protein
MAKVKGILPGLAWFSGAQHVEDCRLATAFPVIGWPFAGQPTAASRATVSP